MSEPRVDWHRVLDDFAFLGMTGDALADRIGVPADELQRIATGQQWVAPAVGGRIECLWRALTGKPLDFLPRTVDPEGAPRPEVPGIESNAERSSIYAQLQAVTAGWVRVPG